MNTITRTAQTLRLLGNQPCRFTDIARELELTKSTAHRLLTSLEKAELIKKNPVSGLYHLGPLIFQLSTSPIDEHQFLIVSAHEEMQRLRDLSGETVNLQVSMGTDRICLEEAQSEESIKYVSGKGAMYPIFVGSAGKMLMAGFSDPQIEMLMRKFDFYDDAPNAIKDPDALLDAIKEARKLGHSISFGERVPGSASVAVPVNNYICPAVINVLGPVDRFTEGSISNILPTMKECAAKISEGLIRMK